MSKVVLVTGSESLTGRKLIEKLLDREYTVVAPVAGKETERNETGTTNLTVLTWNRSSWFSAKAVIRETLRLHGQLDAAWILNSQVNAVPAFSEAGSGDVEDVLEHSIKGNIALIRELSPVLSASGGFLGMVAPHRVGGDPGPLEALSDGAFNGFATSLIRETMPSLWACGFYNASPDAEGFTDAILKQWDEKPAKLRGRWYRYSNGRGPFGRPGIADTI